MQYSDVLIPVMGIAAGVAVGVIQLWNVTRDKAITLQYEALEHRVEQCEKCRDVERERHEAVRVALNQANERIGELERKYDRGKPNAGA